MRRWAAGVRTGADYVQGVWVRLNGGGQRPEGVIAGLPAGLQMPSVNKEARAAATKSLSVEISNLEKRLQESSKVGLGGCPKKGLSRLGLRWWCLCHCLATLSSLSERPLRWQGEGGVWKLRES